MLIAQLTKCFDGISEQINDLGDKFNDLGRKFDSMQVAVKSELKDIRNIATEARDLAKANAAAIVSMEKHIYNVERKCNVLTAKNNRLTEMQESQDTYSRRENLVIRGIDEREDETEDVCVNVAKDIFINKMNIGVDAVNNMTIVRCHRLGNKDTSGTYKRPIIVRFLNYNDRKLVWNNRMVLANTAISVSENFANRVEHRSKLLYPVMKLAKKSAKYNKAHLRGDILIVDDVEYSLRNEALPDFPDDLHPRQFSTKSNGEWIIFGGPHSAFNPLSNYYREPLLHNNVIHDTLEHAYQYAKASRYKDSATEDKILCSSTPAEAKQAGLHVRNFDRADWEEAKKGIMLELLRIKFQAGSEMNKFLKNTSGKSLAEAGKSRSFAIGMPLNSKNIFDTSKWPKNCNMLGKCLMEVRTELNA